jgi:hypothetical protein
VVLTTCAIDANGAFNESAANLWLWHRAMVEGATVSGWPLHSTWPDRQGPPRFAKFCFLA